MGNQRFESEINGAIARLARSLHSHQVAELEIEDLLLEVTRSATDMLPGVKHAGVTLVTSKRRKPQSLAATGDIPKQVDALQERHQQGPCLESIWDRHTVLVDDFENESRWPMFVADLLSQTPVRSSLSIQLFTNERELGALNLYSDTAHTFTADIEEVGLVLATHAAIGLASARRTDELYSALASRDIIGQAKGIIMERFDVNAVRAFELLRKLSQETNTPLNEVARRLVQRDHPSE
ncbi:GAF and ANTAR domain-containing protein [Mycobacterium sp. MYCO198283]|uniref:GAF and ANTAR domain-containing protein n=1 Tax=Mycobacterium sp. MYCO198283 TaxID=2883505 RepID=UPI001E46445C|nr:GAF and ANTAR domain-containing protein [Mycobacterium sp. MYCO198283]MCG5433930.1 GAF and ANTAR domain-containing protein [Mycobacterium sp. MYCO198283]